jgi:hypothetical protein
VADVGGRPPFWERRRFQGAAALVGLVGAVWALVGAPKPWDVVADLFSSELPSSNTQIVLDASAAMSAPFGDGTKLDAAAEAIGDYVVPLSNEGLALRRFGGGCEEAGELLVDFGEEHADEVQAAASAQQPEGESNLAYAVRAAIDDFASEDFPDPDGPKSVLVFTGTGEDDCVGNAPDEVRRALERSGVDAVFKFVGVKVPQSERTDLRNLRDALGERAEVEFVDTEEDLEEIVAPVVEPSPEGTTSDTTVTGTTEAITTTDTTTTIEGTTTDSTTTTGP